MSFKSYSYHYSGKKNANKAARTTSVLLSFLTATFAILFVLNYLVPSLLLPHKTGKLTTLQKDKLKNTYEVFGFAPYWTMSKMDNVDFNVLTTLAYFDLPINSDGSIDRASNGYKKFRSEAATELFEKAHANGTRVVATITQMDNKIIKDFLDDSEAQNEAIVSVIDEVKSRGIDGVNIDFEYVGDAGPVYKQKFSTFVENLSSTIHKDIPGSYVTVSVYASSAKYQKIYNIGELARSTDGIFMMAYDFATSGSSNVAPTAPLYGYKEGKYWYDIATAVDDFSKVMPKEKLILGLPWYGYDYPVASPAVKAAKDTGYYTSYWVRRKKYTTFVARPKARAATYALAKKDAIQQEGWDEVAQVGWAAYKDNDGWRMRFLDDEKSLAIKYDFAKEKGLGGVGMWALGFDDGNTELWELLEDKFGKKLVASNL